MTRLSTLLTIAAALLIGACGTSHTQSTTPTINVSQLPAQVSSQARCHYYVLDTMGDLGPDPHCTPGALNPAAVVNPRGTICIPGYTKTIRPPVSVMAPQKRASETAYGAHGNGEFDHLVALEDGGSPNNPHNLWFEPGPTPNAKDKIENHLHKLICSGQITIHQAAHVLESNWTKGLTAR